MAELDPIEFFKPLGVQPSSGDLTQTIFQAAQLAQAKRETQRQAIQGLIDTFITVSKLNQEKIKMDQDMQNARAALEINQQELAIKQEQLELDKEKAGRSDIIYDPSEDKFRPVPKGFNFSGFIPFDPHSQLRGQFTKDLIALNTVEGQLERIYQEAQGTESSRVVGGLRELSGLLGFDPAVQKINNQELMRTFIARMLGKEVGNLTETEQQVAAKLSPKATDTPQERKDKLSVIRSMVAVNRKALVESLDPNYLKNEIAKVVQQEAQKTKISSFKQQILDELKRRGQ